ncbi:hypothetical protein [Methyloceanibacter sp.]|uniref:hypothetical protein n=1 Tax=Methyloceanibacter sp. TaxID=1965321 RepID=UPI002D713078|nr:hypothetical protein [Methyloceanibacter sp.]HZP07984.1 hypothetical protein [Methyloceanibacter sp.]
MNRAKLIGALAATAALTASLPLLAEPLPWPWKSKTPADPALVNLTSVEDVKVAISKSEPPLVAITVSASAPTPNFTELQLAPRMGDPNDEIFAFDAKGRPPQDFTTQVITPVTFTAEYTGAPLDKIGVIEIHSLSNCKAFSVKEQKVVECTSQSVPQQ